MTLAFPPTRILVGISSAPDADEFAISTSDRAVFRQAMWLAKGVGADIRAFHVKDFVDASIAAGRSHVANLLDERVRDQMDAMLGPAQLERLTATMGMARGKPSDALLDEAARWRADLIVVGSRRDQIGIGQRLLHGSTSRHLLRKAPCSVWVVPPPASHGVSRVLALVDGSRVSSHVVDAAAGIARVSGAAKAIMRCVDFPDDMAVRRLASTGDTVRRYHNEVRESALADLTALTGGEAAGWRIHVDTRSVLQALNDQVETEQHDLIVIGATSKRRLAALLLGTTAQTILDTRALPTYVVRAD